MDHGEIYEDNWENEDGEWLPYLKIDVLSTAFSYARYSKSMGKITVFGMKNSITLPSSAIKYPNNLRDENDEPFYTYNDEYKLCFVRQCIKRGRCRSFSHYYKSVNSDEVFNIISKELNVNGNRFDILDKFFEYTNKRRKIIEIEYDSQFEDYRYK